MSLQKDLNVVRRYIKNKYGKVATVYIHKPKKDDELIHRLVDCSIKIIRKAYPGSVPNKNLAGSSRKRAVVSLKQALMYILRRELHYTSSAISRATGMNHATVLYAETQAAKFFDTGDKLFLESYKLIKSITDVGTAESDNQEGVDPESMSLAIFHKGENIIGSI